VSNDLLFHSNDTVDVNWVRHCLSVVGAAAETKSKKRRDELMYYIFKKLPLVVPVVDDPYRGNHCGFV
jgi:hypothetical protein